MKSKLVDNSFAYVPYTDRTMVTSLSHEAIQPSRSLSTKQKTILSVNDMSVASNIDAALEEESSVLQKTAPELFDQFLNSNSYSRSMAQVTRGRCAWVWSPLPP